MTYDCDERYLTHKRKYKIPADDTTTKVLQNHEARISDNEEGLVELDTKIDERYNELDEKKTDLTGDHKGTWQGYEPTEVEPSIGAIVLDNQEKISKIAVDIKNFGGVGNANYFNVSDSQWYEDDLFTVLANDDTQALKDALSFETGKVRHVIISDGNYQVDPFLKPNVLSNTVLEFTNEAKLVAKRNDEDITFMLELDDVENVVILNPTIIGDREYNSKTTEGAGHLIYINGGKNVSIINSKLSNAYTDALYLRNFDGVYIRGIEYDNNRRQGISVTGGVNLLIENGVISNTNGVPPQFGIDLEPNFATDEMKNLVIRNVRTVNNVGSGIGLSLNGMDDGTKIVDITIEGCTDDGSTYGFSARGFDTNVLEGSSINVIDFKSLNSKACGINILGYKADNTPHLKLVRPVVHNCNTSDGTNQRVNDVGISIHPETSGFPTGTDVGNVEIINPIITMESGREILRGIYVGYVEDPKNVKIIDPIKIDIGNLQTISVNNSRSLIGVGRDTNEVEISDNLNALKVVTDNTNSYFRNGNTGVFSEIRIENTGGNILLQDFLRISANKKIRIFKLNVNVVCTVTLPTTSTFVDKDGVVITGSVVSSSSTNQGLLIEKLTDGIYKVIVESGTWTVTP